jgi:hypothetical protein
MKRKELSIFSIVTILVVAASSFLTFAVFSNQSVGGIISRPIAQEVATETELVNTCSNEAKNELVTESSNRYLRRLNAYQEICQSFIADEFMIFTIMPLSDIAIEEQASILAQHLIDFNAAGISPLVVSEPTDENGNINFVEFSTGSRRDSISKFFAALRAKGVDDSMIGTWVPFPEPNVPNWDSLGSNYETFGTNVNIFMEAATEQYPTIQGSILLNATSYEPTDLEWNEGDYISLIPWGQFIEHEYIHSVGIQGFPWMASADRLPVQLFDPEEFLQPDFIVALAKELRTKNIWINS